MRGVADIKLDGKTFPLTAFLVMLTSPELSQVTSNAPALATWQQVCVHFEIETSKIRHKIVLFVSCVRSSITPILDSEMVWNSVFLKLKKKKKSIVLNFLFCNISGAFFKFIYL